MIKNQTPDGWLRAIDEALVVTHLGVANAEDSYEMAKRKLNELICWHVAVALDPAVSEDAVAARVTGAEQPTSHAFDDSATIAGLKSAVSHLSACLDEFRALLVEVNDVCGRDGHGGPLEDGESEIIDRVRAALSMTEASPQEPKEIFQ